MTLPGGCLASSDIQSVDTLLPGTDKGHHVSVCYLTHRTTHLANLHRGPSHISIGLGDPLVVKTVGHNLHLCSVIEDSDQGIGVDTDQVRQPGRAHEMLHHKSSIDTVPHPEEELVSTAHTDTLLAPVCVQVPDVTHRILLKDVSPSDGSVVSIQAGHNVTLGGHQQHLGLAAGVVAHVAGLAYILLLPVKPPGLILKQSRHTCHKTRGQE